MDTARNVGRKIVELRKERGISRKELADDLNIPYTTLRNYEEGSREPGHLFLVRIAQRFNISTDYLLGIINFKKPLEANSQEINLQKKHMLDLFDTLNAAGRYAVINYADILSDLPKYRYSDEKDIDCHYIPCAKIPINNDFDRWLSSTDFELIPIPNTSEYTAADYALLVNDDSMSPDYLEGDTVLVHIQASVDIGEVGFYFVDNMGYIREKGEDELLPKNHCYQKIQLYGKDCRCIGKVYSKFEKQ